MRCLCIIENLGGQAGNKIYVRPIKKIMVSQTDKKVKIFFGNRNCLKVKDKEMLEELFQISCDKNQISYSLKEFFLGYEYIMRDYCIDLDFKEGVVMDFSYMYFDFLLHEDSIFKEVIESVKR